MGVRGGVPNIDFCRFCSESPGHVSTQNWQDEDAADDLA